MTILGVHVVQGPRDKYGDFLRRLANAGKPVVVYAVDDPAPLREAKEVLGAAALTVLRYDKLRDADGEQQDLQGVNPENFGHDAAAAARHYMDICLPTWEDQRDAADFFGTTNEWSFWHPFQHAFHAACMDIAEARGFKLALYAFSSGNPPVEFAGEDFVANCRRMKERGHVLSVHEYGLVESGRLRDGVPFHAQRVAHLYQAVLAPRSADPGCIVTEFAFGGGHYAPETFLDNVRWYTENVLRRYSFIIGGTIFTLGNWQDGVANFQASLAELADYITSLPEAAPDDPPIQPPFVYPSVGPPPSLAERNAPPFEVIDTLSRPEPSPPSTAWRGLHMRADGHSTEDDFQCIRIAKLNAAKIMTNTSFQEYARLRTLVPPDRIVLRLFAAGNNPSLGNAERFFNEQLAWLTEFSDHGGRFVEIHNEPNLRSEGLGTFWRTASEFGDWYSEVARKIRAAFPALLRGWPGLSPQPNVPEFIEVLRALISSDLVDWIGAHAYWVNEDGLQDPLNEHARYYRRFLNMGRPVLITEFSNLGGTDSDELKGQQYKRYYNTLESGVLAAFSFVSSASDPTFNHQKRETWVRDDGAVTAIPHMVGA